MKPRELQACDIAFQFWRPETLFDATSGGNPVAPGDPIARAEDVSGNGNHATQSGSTERPTRQVAARNGLDVARFDGSNDVLNAGDVADMLANPVEVYAVFIRTGVAGTKGIFGKSRAAVGAGRWAVLHNSTDGFLFAGSVGGNAATLAASTQLQVIFGHHPRGSVPSAVIRNASIVSTTAVTDDGSAFDTTDPVLVGAYQDASGLPSLTGSFLGGDMIECAKFSRNLEPHARLRVQHAAMRRARIAG